MIDLIKAYVGLSNYGFARDGYDEVKADVEALALRYPLEEVIAAKSMASIIVDTQRDIHTVMSACYDVSDIEARIDDAEAFLKESLPDDFVEEVLGDAYMW